MKHLLCSIVFFLSFCDVNSQSHPYSIKFSHQIETDIANGDIPSARAATLYSLIGEYQLSSRYSDIPVSWGVVTMDMSTYSTDSAITHIIEAAAHHKLVVISENQMRP